MQHGSRRRSALAAPFLLLALAGASVGHVAASDETTAYPVSVQACDDATKQLCTPLAIVPVTTSGALRVEFTAAATHCSDAIAHLLVDGTERFASGRLGPGQSSGVQDFGPVTTGAHTLGIQVEGVLGGCNVGGVSGWGGTLAVTVSTAPAETPSPTTGSEATPSAAASLSPTPSAAPTGNAGGSGDTLWLFAILGGGLLLFLWFILARRRRRRDREEPVSSADQERG